MYVQVHQPNTALVSETTSLVCTSTTTLVHSWPAAGPLCHSCTNFVAHVHTQAVISKICVVLG